MEKFSLDLYNLNEWLLLRLFRVITGFKLAFNPHLKNIRLMPIANVQENLLTLIQTQVNDEFGIHVETFPSPLDYPRAFAGRYLNVSYLANKLNQSIPRDKDTALLGISNYWLTPTPFLLSRIIHTFYPILGITYLAWGICFLTTLQGLLKTNLLQFAVKHEVGHLLGLHGYPLFKTKTEK